MTDLTQITTPFGLLDPETQRALREHGGPYEIYSVEITRLRAEVETWKETARASEKRVAFTQTENERLRKALAEIADPENKIYRRLHDEGLFWAAVERAHAALEESKK